MSMKVVGRMKEQLREKEGEGDLYTFSFWFFKLKKIDRNQNGDEQCWQSSDIRN